MGTDDIFKKEERIEKRESMNIRSQKQIHF